MNNQKTTFIALSAALFGLQSLVPAIALPVYETEQFSALLGSPIAQIPLDDPILKRAMEVLREKYVKERMQRKLDKPDSPIGQRPRQDLNHRLILGGPEIVPM